MNKGKKIMYIILFLVFAILFIGSMKHISVYATMMTEIVKYPGIWTGIGVFGLLIIGILFSHMVEHVKNVNWIARILWGLLCLIELVFLLLFSCYPTSDSAEVVSAAIELANGNIQYMETAAYFEKYGNNNLLTIATSWIYDICQWISKGNIDFVLLNSVINILFLNGAVYLAYQTVKSIKGEKSACKMLFLAVCNPVQYMAIFWYYSATISSFFVMFLLYMAVKEKKRKMLGTVGIGVVTAVGYALRPTVVITTIAILMVGFLLQIKKKKSLWQYVGFVSVLCLSMLATTVTWKMVSKVYISESKENHPITRWISIGLEGDGTVGSYGENYPKEVRTTKERMQYDKERMSKNLSQYNLITFPMHLAKKLYINWCDGSSALNVKLKSDRKLTVAYDFIVAQKADGWLVYCQAFRAFIYLFVLMSLVKNWKNEVDKTDICYVNIAGGILFYLIWEVKSDYSIPFILLFFMVASDGMEWGLFKTKQCIHKAVTKTEQVKKIGKRLILLGGFLFLFLFGVFYEKYGKEERNFIKNSVAMNGIKPMGKISDVAKNNKKILQMVRTEKPFQFVKLYCKKISGTGSYRIRLYRINMESGEKSVPSIHTDFFGINDSNYENDEDVVCVEQWENISGAQVRYEKRENCLLYDEQEEKGYLWLNCKELLEAGEYVLQICPETGKDSIAWNYNPYPFFNYYEGEMYWSGELVDGELGLHLGYEQKEPYMSQLGFVIGEAVVCLVTVLCYIWGVDCGIGKRKRAILPQE